MIQPQCYLRFAADFFVLFLADFFVLFLAAGFFFVGIMYHPLSMVDKPILKVIGELRLNSSDICKIFAEFFYCVVCASFRFAPLRRIFFRHQDWISIAKPPVDRAIRSIERRCSSSAARYAASDFASRRAKSFSPVSISTN